MRRIPLLLAWSILVAGICAIPPRLISRTAVNPDFVHFESSQVHPLAITPDGTRLLVVNTPDNRLSVFDLTGDAPALIAEIPVGLEPVSVAAASDAEAWVVNNLSDDVSIVDLASLHTRATVRVGDEPNDVVFAGSPIRAYVSVSQEDRLKVYDPANPAAAETVIPIPGRMPRALAKTPDGSQVLVDVFNSSGSATALSAHEVGDSLPAPDPPLAEGLPPPPEVGLIVKQDAVGNWVDPTGYIWNSKVPYQVPDVELVYINTATRTVAGSRGGIATIMMGLATSPVTGAAAASGIYAILEKRLEPNVRGHFTDQRLGIVPDLAGALIETELNPHIDYDVSPGPASEGDSALGLATGVCWTPDGQRILVTSLSTDKLGVVSAAGQLLARVPTVAGPTGVIADPARERVYVLGRHRNQIQTLSSADFASLDVRPIGFDPTPDAIVNGRKFFYGGFTSGHGDQACASCHLFGDIDNLVWDLGNPNGSMLPEPPGMPDPSLEGFHPMKGPMATQTLRGLMNSGVLHWRGDRANLDAFNPAFVSLMGRSSQLPDSELAAMDDFILPLAFPPNPNELLDRTMPYYPPGTPSASRGQDFFLNQIFVDSFGKCKDCHALPTGSNRTVINHMTLMDSQDMKVPQLRNLYKKTGFQDSAGAVNKRGFGFTHDGSIDNLFHFLHFAGFTFGSPESLADARRRDVEAYLLAFDTGTAPAVGHQLTFNGSNNANPTLLSTLDTLKAQATAGNCQLIAKGRVGSTPRGWLYQGSDLWKPDLIAGSAITSASLRALASSGHEITITGVPPGSGQRMGIDRDRDGYLDADELAAGSNPGDPLATPANVGTPGAATLRSGLAWAAPNPFRSGTDVAFTLARPSRVDLVVFDLLGRQVRSLARQHQFSAGAHHVRWDGKSDAGREALAGVYFLRMRGDGSQWTRAVIRIR